jgi:hypothetical protein
MTPSRMRRNGARHSIVATPALVTFLALALTACDVPPCQDDQFVVNENGSCASSPQQFTITATSCHVSLNATADAGLPIRGEMGADPVPLRQGGFILYADSPSFRYCRAVRVDYRLELTCFDNDGAQVCQADLTEPAM